MCKIKNIKKRACKAIYALHLIDGDNTIDAGGVECEMTCPFIIEMTKIPDGDIYESLNGITFLMHIGIQYWSK